LQKGENKKNLVTLFRESLGNALKNIRQCPGEDTWAFYDRKLRLVTRSQYHDKMQKIEAVGKLPYLGFVLEGPVNP
jgi:hypothetical protein